MLNNNGKAGLLVYTSGGYWYGNVKIEEGAKFTASGNANGIEILPEGILDMQDGTVTLNHSNSYGGACTIAAALLRLAARLKSTITMQILQVTIFIVTALIKIGYLQSFAHLCTCR